MLDKIEALAEKHHMFPAAGTILAAVSGGADSVSLLSALLLLRETHGFTVAAAHYNHRLRGNESEADQQFVERLCRELNTSLYIGSADVSAFALKNHLGIEEAARWLRYDFFDETAKKIGAARIATAHTADDNAETVIFNLTRGAGLNGLGGIPPVRENIIRPMLTVSRDEVLSFLTARRLSYVEDSSNASEQYSRNRIRHRVIPVLKDLNPRLTDSISGAVSRIREDEAFLSGLASRFIEENVKIDTAGARSLDAKALGALPRPVSARVVRILSGTRLSSEHTEAVLALACSNSTGGEITLPSVTAYREYGHLVFSAARLPDGFPCITLTEGCRIPLPEVGLTVSCRKTKKTDCNEKINKSFTTFLFKFDSIYGNIVIRPRETGDKIELFGRIGTKSLKKLFIEKRIPVRKRSLIPVIADQKGVLGIYGLGIDKRAAFLAGESALEIMFEETAYEK